jgi:hypothetical protein
MAVAAPKLRSSPAAPPPSRTAPPEPKKRPRDRPKAGGRTATPRKVRTDDPPRKPGRRTGAKKASASAAATKAAPSRKKGATARSAAAKAAPARRKVAPRRRSAGVIPIAAGHAGRAAVAVTQLPESGLIHRLTRGRIWIGVLGLLLVGIVALNVVTLSFAASSGKVDATNTELSKENSMMQSRWATAYGQRRMGHEAAELGLAMPTEAVPQLINSKGSDVAEAAARLAAAGAAVAGTTEASGETSGGEAGSGEGATGGEEAATGGEVASGEGAVTGEEAAATTGESEFTPEEEAIFNREYEELLAAEGLTE